MRLFLIHLPKKGLCSSFSEELWAVDTGHLLRSFGIPASSFLMLLMYVNVLKYVETLTVFIMGSSLMAQQAKDLVLAQVQYPAQGLWRAVGMARK